ncbi:MAG: dihydrofolate reductase [Proteobacteria bacterium]|nr:dihydrofolate reductase [Pseudomonadota bacterium]
MALGDPDKRLAIIVAMARNHVIGLNNEMPWHLPDDLKFFKKMTIGKTVIMGRRTWESLRMRPLPERQNIVLSRDPYLHLDGALVVESLAQAIDQAASDEIMLIGGAELYAQTLPICDRLYLTEVDAAPDGDAFFPALDPADWRETAAEPHPADARHAHAFTWRTLERVRR